MRLAGARTAHVLYEDYGNYFYTDLGKSAVEGAVGFGYSVTRNVLTRAEGTVFDASLLNASLDAALAAAPDVLVAVVRQPEWIAALARLSAARPSTASAGQTVNRHAFKAVWFQARPPLPSIPKPSRGRQPPNPRRAHRKTARHAPVRPGWGLRDLYPSGFGVRIAAAIPAPPPTAPRPPPSAPPFPPSSFLFPANTRPAAASRAPAGRLLVRRLCGPGPTLRARAHRLSVRPPVGGSGRVWRCAPGRPDLSLAPVPVRVHGHCRRLLRRLPGRGRHPVAHRAGLPAGGAADRRGSAGDGRRAGAEAAVVRKAGRGRAVAAR